MTQGPSSDERRKQATTFVVGPGEAAVFIGRGFVVVVVVVVIVVVVVVVVFVVVVIVVAVVEARTYNIPCGLHRPIVFLKHLGRYLLRTSGL